MLTSVTNPFSVMIAEALILNNEGVSYLLGGKPQQAILCLKRSLSLFDSCLQTNSLQAPVLSRTNLKDSCIFSSAPFLGNMEERSDFQLYGSAIALTRPLDEASAMGNLAFYTAAAMLNLALCYHQLGQMIKLSASKQDQARSPGILLRADRLYQAVLRVMDVTIQEDAAVAAAFRFLSLAAQNNRLAIALEVGLSDSVVLELKEVMDQMINFIKVQGCSTMGHEERYLNEFFLNSAVLDITSMFTTLAAPSA